MDEESEDGEAKDCNQRTEKVAEIFNRDCLENVFLLVDDISKVDIGEATVHGVTVLAVFRKRK